LTLTAIYHSRVGVVGSAFAAALTQVSTVDMPPAVAAQHVGVGPCRGETCGEMFWVMALIAPLQPSEATARVGPRSPIVPMANNKILLDPRPFGLDSKLFSKVRFLAWRRSQNRSILYTSRGKQPTKPTLKVGGARQNFSDFTLIAKKVPEHSSSSELSRRELLRPDIKFMGQMATESGIRFRLRTREHCEK
jgi:hypothetical protein